LRRLFLNECCDDAVALACAAERKVDDDSRFSPADATALTTRLDHAQDISSAHRGVLEIYRESCRRHRDWRLSAEGRKGKVAALEYEFLELSGPMWVADLHGRSVDVTYHLAQRPVECYVTIPLDDASYCFASTTE
jgi:hypothetical protein